MGSAVPKHKFNTIAEGGEFDKHEYGDVYSDEGARLIIAPKERQIKLLLELTKKVREPFLVRYVLQVGNDEYEPGRYDLDQEFSYEELERFFTRFGEFFENDGRHHIWVRSDASDATLVYDQHNVIFAYGPLRSFRQTCEASGLREGNVDIPFPHAHAFHKSHDADLRTLLSWWTWTRTGLVEDIDDV